MATKQMTKPQLEEENTALKKELQDTQSQIDELRKQLELLTSMQMANKTAEFVDTSSNEINRNITFVNMTTGTVVLQGSQIWTIEGQFNSRSFSIREARVIVNNMNNFIREGYVFITDSNFVKENDLFDSYQNLLSDEALKNLLFKNAQEVANVYQMVSDAQKEIIIRMIYDKRLNNQHIDANILVELGRLSGKNLMGIEPLEDDEDNS